MGQPPVICCTLREKQQSDGNGVVAPLGPPQFFLSEVHLRLDKPKFLVFAPLWRKDTSSPKRLALATAHEVHIYTVIEETYDCSAMSDASWTTKASAGDEIIRLTDETHLRVILEYQMCLDCDLEVTSIAFMDEISSKNLVVAVGPADNGALMHKEHAYQVRIFTCGAEARNFSIEERKPTAWRWNKDHAASLEDHDAPVERVVTSLTTFVTLDSQGTCATWKKSQGLSQRHASTKLHKGSVADIAVERHFMYACGREDKTISVWSVPNLAPVFEIVADVFPFLTGLDVARKAVFDPARLPDNDDNDDDKAKDSTQKGAAGDQDSCKAKPLSSVNQVAALTALIRPLSRWAGSQGASRSADAPRGTLFVAATLADSKALAPACMPLHQADTYAAVGTGAGVIMEWSMGHKKAICTSAHVAHDSPIVSIAYGPYDNGPVITADRLGIFRVWDIVPKLTLAQQLAFAWSPGTIPHLSVAIEPQKGVFTSCGDRRLFIWRRNQPPEVFEP